MHVDTDLSAYLDGELDAADRVRVEAHLDTCERCRSRLSELRATASLISALPTPRPARSLVPHVGRLRTVYGVDEGRAGWSWLRPIRSFSALASGAFLFAFLVTAVARSGGGLGGGSPTGAFAPVQNAPTAAPAVATAAPEAAAPRAFSPLPQLPAPAAVGQPAPTAAADAARSAAATAAAATAAAPFALQPTAPPKAAEVATPSAPPRVEVTSAPVELATRSVRDEPRPSPLTDPLVWLGLAVIAAVVAIGAHWRLRRVA